MTSFLEIIQQIAQTTKKHFRLVGYVNDITAKVLLAKNGSTQEYASKMYIYTFEIDSMNKQLGDTFLKVSMLILIFLFCKHRVFGTLKQIK